MCGIIGYVGRHQAQPILLDGLARLEYRGYDSAGIAVMDGACITIRKSAGRLSKLCEMLDGYTDGSLRHRPYALGNARCTE